MGGAPRGVTLTTGEFGGGGEFRNLDTLLWIYFKVRLL